MSVQSNGANDRNQTKNTICRFRPSRNSVPTGWDWQRNGECFDWTDMASASLEWHLLWFFFVPSINSAMLITTPINCQAYVDKRPDGIACGAVECCRNQAFIPCMESIPIGTGKGLIVRPACRSAKAERVLMGEKAAVLWKLLSALRQPQWYFMSCLVSPAFKCQSLQPALSPVAHFN